LDEKSGAGLQLFLITELCYPQSVELSDRIKFLRGRVESLLDQNHDNLKASLKP